LAVAQSQNPLNALALEVTHLQQIRKRVKEPSVAINLLLILFFHAKYNLRRHNTFVGVPEVEVRVESEGGGVFK
jgi:hypothetical protein